MIDINLIRENPSAVKENIKKRFQTERIPLVVKIRKKDKEWRELKKKVDKLRQERNQISKKISEAKKEGKDTAPLLKKAKQIPGRIDREEKRSSVLAAEMKEMLLKIPNMIHESVPIGKDSSDNVEIKKMGSIKKFGFPVRNHIEIAKSPEQHSKTRVGTPSALYIPTEIPNISS